MMKSLLIVSFSIILCFTTFAQRKGNIRQLSGINLGKTLFIQNTIDTHTHSFCVTRIEVNDKVLHLNYNLSALLVNFEGINFHAPVKIVIYHRDNHCVSTILNPDAILLSSIFQFHDIHLSDTALIWRTKGEKRGGSFDIERIENNQWVIIDSMPAKGTYHHANYRYLPSLEKGSNKYRIKYYFPKSNRFQYIYSFEMEYDYYPPPVKINSKRVKRYLNLSRNSNYEIYDSKAKKVLEGFGNMIDLSRIPKGNYVIYLDEEEATSFVKE